MSKRQYLEELGIAYPDCGFWVEEGWQPLVDRTLKKLIEAGWNKRLVQVKQKFCVLTIYLESPVPENLQAILQEASKESQSICEWCGGPREGKSFALGRALCPSCQDAP